LTAKVVDTDNPWQVSGAVTSNTDGPGVMERRQLAGKWVSVRRSPVAGGTKFFAVLERDEGGRIVLCVEPGEGRACPGVLEVLAERPWRGVPVEDAVVVADPPLSLRGQPVTVPVDCEDFVMPDGGEVRCGTAMVVWARESVAGAQRRADYMRRMIADITGTEVPLPELRPCRLAGVRTTCSMWLMKTPDGQVLGATAYIVEGGAALSGECVAYGALQLETPPCPILFAPE
jgi:hypothetical protein